MVMMMDFVMNQIIHVYYNYTLKLKIRCSLKKIRFWLCHNHHYYHHSSPRNLHLAVSQMWWWSGRVYFERIEELEKLVYPMEG